MSKIDKVVAQAEFERFLDENDIDHDQSTFSPEELSEWERMRNSLLRRICDGSLVLDEKGIFTFTPKHSDDTTPIVFHRPKGSALIAMDRKKKGEDVGKMYATMGEMCHVDAKRFSLMDGGDVKVCMSIATLFLA
jgi:hypothetical protein